ncbi:MAG: site-2 protease family protein [Spirochaetes bacterium]|nr:site-2 protease family protein [Spirochaetota bacterium]
MIDQILQKSPLILSKILGFIIFYTPVLIAVICHEIGHAYAAYLLGDDTAKKAGRFSINPLKHIDLFGTIILPILLYYTVGFPLVMFKPVPVDHSKLHNPEKDSIKVALAGPGANLLLVILSVTMIRVFGLMEGIHHTFFYKFFIQKIGFLFILFNLIIMTFNLLPIPPLDGSWVIRGMLSVKYKFYFQKYYTYFVLGFLILILTRTIHYILMPIWNFFVKLTGILTGFS